MSSLNQGTPPSPENVRRKHASAHPRHSYAPSHKLPLLTGVAWGPWPEHGKLPEADPIEDLMLSAFSSALKIQPEHPRINPKSKINNFTKLPTELIFSITAYLDPLSEKCLSTTSRQFRILFQNIPLNFHNTCLRWKAACYRERASMFRSQEIPSLLACAFCKSAHPTHYFAHSVHHPYYPGMQWWKDPSTRYCPRHISKRIIHLPAPDNANMAAQAESLPTGEWATVLEKACGHCGSRMEGKSVCSSCNGPCDVCGIVTLPTFVRFGYLGNVPFWPRMSLVKRRGDYRLRIRGLEGGSAKPVGRYLNWPGREAGRFAMVEWPEGDAWRKRSTAA